MRRPRWFKRLRQFFAKSSLPDAQQPLREFVYLDTVSVYSLVASRQGAIPSEITDSETSTLRSEIASTAEVNAAVAKGAIKASGETTQSSGSQIVRKSIVQATFRELLMLEEETLPLRARGEEADAPAIDGVEDLIAACRGPNSSQWILDAEELARGQLLEVEVELETEATFRISAIFNAMIEIFDENPNLIDPAALPGMLEGIVASRILDKLLVGLVPLRGRVIHYRHVTLSDGEERIVHEQLLEGLPVSHHLKIRPLYLVGVAESDLFWRDIRRVLFSKSTFTVMCRLGRSGAQPTWTPVKLVDVLKEVTPELGLHLQTMEGILKGAGQASGDEEELAKQTAMRRALIRYADDLASERGESCPESALVAAGLPNVEQTSAYRSVEERRQAFSEIRKWVEERFSVEFNAREAASMRMVAQVDSSLGFDGELLPTATPTSSIQLSPGLERRYLDSEIIAIYW